MTFTHAQPSTAADAWQLGDLPALDQVDERRLVVLAAHPDDETLGAGGLMAHLAALGAEIDVVVASSGEASHPDSTTWTPAQLASVREREVRAAVHALAPAARVHLLRLPDGHLADHVPQMVERLRELVRPGCLLVAPWRGDAHPDHEAASRAADQAGDGVRLLEYPIWLWHWAGPDDVRVPRAQLRRWDLPAQALQRKATAMRAHVSQVKPLSQEVGDEVLLPADVLAHFERPYEVFVEPVDADSMTGADFDRFYAESGEDPWGFIDRWYELRKRALTMASLPRQHFGRVFEPGCSIGMLTELLAPRCDDLLATDVSALAVERARSRTSRFGHVRVERGSVPGQWPDGAFDLVVLSEVGYYSGRVDLSRLVTRATRSLSPGGVLLACHWRHPVEQYPITGDQVHERLRSEPGLDLIAQHVEEDFVLEVFGSTPAISVARATGLLS